MNDEEADGAERRPYHLAEVRKDHFAHGRQPAGSALRRRPQCHFVISFNLRRALVFLLSGISLSLLAADKATTGTPAPPLNLEKLLQAPADAVASWDALK